MVRMKVRFMSRLYTGFPGLGWRFMNWVQDSASAFSTKLVFFYHEKRVRFHVLDRGGVSVELQDGS
jgi:hypothetical protein